MARLKTKTPEELVEDAQIKIGAIVSETEGLILDPQATVKHKKKLNHNYGRAGGNLDLFVKGGLSPNTGGRPKGRVSINNFLHRELIDHPDKARAIAKKLISLALAGNLQAIQEILDRTDGKVAEVHRIDSENPITLLLAPAQQLLNTRIVESEPVLIEAGMTPKTDSLESDEMNNGVCPP